MIAKWIRNETSRKRYLRFIRQKRALVSIWLLVGLTFVSFTAEFWSNSKPIFLSYNGKWYVPFMRQYHPTEFGRTDIYEMDYRSLQSGFSVWPPNSWDPYESNTKVASYPSGPTRENWFGTDDRGRDVVARLLYGFRYSMIFAVLTWALSYVVGIAAGALMGFLGGATDLVGQRIVEIFMTMPALLLLITLISIFSPSMVLLVCFMTLFDWTVISLYVRGEFLKLRKRDFTEAAKALGSSKLRVIFRHILPNALGPVITLSPLAISANIVALANLDYLGLGLRPPTPSWGELLAQARQHFTTAWWLAVFPSVALVGTLILMNLIGESLRQALDPRKP